jgi:hypothetical protein
MTPVQSEMISERTTDQGAIRGSSVYTIGGKRSGDIIVIPDRKPRKIGVQSMPNNTPSSPPPPVSTRVSVKNSLVRISFLQTVQLGIKSLFLHKMRAGQNTVIWVIDGGTEVKPGDELVRLDTLFIEEQIAESFQPFIPSTQCMY